MDALCLHDLAAVVDGELCLGTMPPPAGRLTRVGRSVTSLENCRRRDDLLWSLPAAHGADAASQCPEAAFLRGAQGVVCARRIEPWAGCFSLRVPDPANALKEWADWVRGRYAGHVVLAYGHAAPWLCRRLQQTIDASCVEESPARLSPDIQAAEAICQLALAAPAWVLGQPAQQKTEVAFRSHLCRPHVAVITPPHDARHPSLDEQETAAAIARATPESGCLLAPGDAPELLRRTDGYRGRRLIYGTAAHCDLRARRSPCRTRWRIETPDQCWELPALPDPLRLSPVLAACAVGRELGHDPQSLSLRLWDDDRRRQDAVRRAV